MQVRFDKKMLRTDWIKFTDRPGEYSQISVIPEYTSVFPKEIADLLYPYASNEYGIFADEMETPLYNGQIIVLEADGKVKVLTGDAT